MPYWFIMVTFGVMKVLSIVGAKAQRIRRLMQADMNLFAYHLPLDMNAEFGNNAELAKLWNLQDDASDAKRVWRTGTLDFCFYR
jgi:Uncharacterized conserved protein